MEFCGEGASWSCVPRDEPLHGLDRSLCPVVRMRVVGRGVRWWMPQEVRSSLVVWAANSGPPSEVRVVGMP